jgi:hypothetical protein
VFNHEESVPAEPAGVAGKLRVGLPERCRWCGRPMPEAAATGRPRQFCRRSCRQRDFEARERARRHGLDETDVIIAREALETLRDQLYVVRCAVDDVRRDLAGSPTKSEYATAVDWLLKSLEPVLADGQDALRR